MKIDFFFPPQFHFSLFGIKCDQKRELGKVSKLPMKAKPGMKYSFVELRRASSNALEAVLDRPIERVWSLKPTLEAIGKIPSEFPSFSSP